HPRDGFEDRREVHGTDDEHGKVELLEGADVLLSIPLGRGQDEVGSQVEDRLEVRGVDAPYSGLPLGLGREVAVVRHAHQPAPRARRGNRPRTPRPLPDRTPGGDGRSWPASGPGGTPRATSPPSWGRP